jgi:septum formation protein
MMETILLASASPRRRELLDSVKVPFRVVPPRCEEDYSAGGDAVMLVGRIALEKARSVLPLTDGSARWILGVDTVVEIDGRILGKPRDRTEAEESLRLLSGRVHRVYTGLALLCTDPEGADGEAACTEVKFRAMSGEEIRFYLDSGEWNGVAGSYRIQERGAFFVDWIRGSYSNVVGLPLEAFYGILNRNRYPFWPHRGG